MLISKDLSVLCQPKKKVVDTGRPSDVFAPYVSCNGPEGEPRSTPENPVCICEVGKEWFGFWGVSWYWHLTFDIGIGIVIVIGIRIALLPL